MQPKTMITSCISQNFQEASYTGSDVKKQKFDMHSFMQEFIHSIYYDVRLLKNTFSHKNDSKYLQLIDWFSAEQSSS